MGKILLLLLVLAVGWDSASANCHFPVKDVGWHSPEIVYQLDDFDGAKVKENHIREAFDMIEANTCLNFIDHENAPGKPVDVQIVRTTRECKYAEDLELGFCITDRKTIIHEMSHYLGLFHTNNRPDWRQFIRVLPGVKENEYDMDCPAVPVVGYDYGSGMHHPLTGKAEPVDDGPGYASSMGQFVRFPFSDYRSINWLFNCSGKCTTQPDCKNGGYIHPRDCTKCMCNNYFVGDFCETPRNLIKLSCEGKKEHTWKHDHEGDTTLKPVLNDDFLDRGENLWDLIEAPPNMKIQVEADSVAGKFPKAPSVVCSVSALEINDGDLNLVGRMFCYNPKIKFEGNVKYHNFTTKSNRVGLHAEFPRYTWSEMNAKFTLLGC